MLKFQLLDDCAPEGGYARNTVLSDETRASIRRATSCGPDANDVALRRAMRYAWCGMLGLIVAASSAVWLLFSIAGIDNATGADAVCAALLMNVAWSCARAMRTFWRRLRDYRSRSDPNPLVWPSFTP